MALKLIQVGMNTSDLPATLELFSEAFGFRNAGGQMILGDLIRIQGLDPTCHALMWWMVGSQPRFQLEFFHHTRPAQRSLPLDWKPTDLGWSRIGIAVEDLDRAVDEMEKRAIYPIAGVVTAGGRRRCAYRDPFVGAVVEVMEKSIAGAGDGNGGAGPALVYASASVSDLDSARDFYTGMLELPLAGAAPVHAPGPDALWGLVNADSRSFLVDAGVLLEIVEYAHPRGRPRRSDYRTSDQGVVNVALGASRRPPIEAAFARLAAGGLKPPYQVDIGDMLAGYITDPEREVELAVIPEALEAELGFVPAGPFLGGSG